MHYSVFRDKFIYESKYVPHAEYTVRLGSKYSYFKVKELLKIIELQ